jgi:hypothetical protein
MATRAGRVAERGALVSLAACAVWSVGLIDVDALAGDGRAVPFRLLVAHYDGKLESFLLSGEFGNELEQPLVALRAVLTLTDVEAQETSTFQIDCGLRREVPPEHTGVCSVWVDYDANDPDHVTLRRQSDKPLQAQFRLLRVRYADRTEEGF